MTAPTISTPVATAPTGVESPDSATAPAFDIADRTGQSGTVLTCRSCGAVFTVTVLAPTGCVAPDPGDLFGATIDCADCPAQGSVAAATIPVADAPHTAAGM